MRCKCGYEFVFRPDKDGLTDGKFTAFMRSASRNDTYHYTFGQLYASHYRKSLPNFWGHVGCGTIALVVALFGMYMQFEILADKEGLPGLILMVLGALGVLGAIGTYRIGGPKSLDEFMKIVNRWREHGKKMDKYISEPSLHDPPPDWPEADIYDYGVTSVLIVNRDILVDWLVLNNFHAEHHCAVISAEGYPKYICSRIVPMLQDDPSIPVYLLHDSMKQKMMLSPGVEQLIGGRKTVDIGLFEDDVEDIGQLKKIRNAVRGNAVPLDFIGYPMLSLGVTTAMAEGLTLGELMVRQNAPDSGGDSGGGSFG